MTLEDRVLACSLDLEPCPFCGQLPAMQSWHGGGPEKQLVGCVGMHPDDEIVQCHVAPQVTGETPEEARDRWNTRA